MLEATQTRTEIKIAPNKQHRRLLLAIVLLLTALTLVLVKDREYWFASNQAAAADVEQTVPVQSTSVETPTTPLAAPAIPVSKPHFTHVAKRAALPPMKIEVAAGKSNGAAVIPAAERVPVTKPQVEEKVDASYPMLDGKTSVQGAVLLQALIAANGMVEDLRVLSGPTILVQAAREAVKQWRFKPYYENGKAVETQARVTVNFTIKVSNNTARYQPSSITSDGAF